jgi:hypothetical protein
VLVSLMVAHPAPDDAPPLETRWRLAGSEVMTLPLAPGPRPTRIRLLASPAAASAGPLRIELETSTWRDPVRGREIGLHVAGQWVLTERLPTRAAIEAAIAQARAERRAEESPDRWWWPAASLYLPHARLRACLEMGPGDDDLLGPGWYHREDWGPHGAMRWTGPAATVHLATPGTATSVRIRAYAGEPMMGAVAGRIVIAHARPGEEFRPAGTTPFALPAASWQELAAPLPPEPGRLRVLVQTDHPRVPCDRVPGSRDDRALGLAVKRIWLA